MPASFRSATLLYYVEVAREAGLDPYALLKRHGIAPAALDDIDELVPAEAVAALLEESASLAGTSDFGLRMAAKRRLSDLGVVSLLMSHQPTLRDVLDMTVRYRSLLNSALTLQVEEAGEVAILKEEVAIESDYPAIQSFELMVAILMKPMRAVLGERWQPLAVHFTHGKPANTAMHRRTFGERIEFDSEFNGLVCLRADLDSPNPSADPNLARYASQLVESLHHQASAPVSFEVRKSAYLLLPLGKVSMPRVARRLGLHEKTLQRRLASEGAEFSELIEEVRRELAKRYLASRTHSLTRIAEMLGYGQQSSFTRWFKKQFGTSPRYWRNADFN